jgi:hypothetical protein
MYQIVILTALFSVSCVQGKRVVYQDENVVVRAKNPAFYPFNVHGDQTIYLDVGGKRYRNVRGIAPYYLKINGDGILFVTDKAGGGITFHVVNGKSKSHISIDGDGSIFGINIGAPRSRGTRDTDYLEEIAPERIAAVTRSRGTKQVSILNLQEKTLERIEMYYYSPDGVVTNRSVYVKGKRVE